MPEHSSSYDSSTVERQVTGNERLIRHLGAEVHLRTLMDSSPDRLSMNPESIGHPVHLYPVVAQLLYGIREAIPHSKIMVKGSTNRHAANLALLGESGHYNPNRLLRFNTQPLLKTSPDTLESLLKDRLDRFDRGEAPTPSQSAHPLGIASEIAETYAGLISGPDLDLKLLYSRNPWIRQEQQQLFSFATEALLPSLSLATLIDRPTRDPQGLAKSLKLLCRNFRHHQSLGPGYGQDNYGDLDYHVFVLPDDRRPPGWSFVARIHKSVDIPPLRPEDYLRHFPFEDPPCLVIAAKQFMARGKIPIMSITLGADMNDFHRDEPFDPSKLHALYTVDISHSLLPREAAIYDARTGQGVTSSDTILSPLKIDTGALSLMPINPRHVTPQSYLNNYGHRFPNLPPNVWIDLKPHTLKRITQPIELGPEWEKKSDADCLEIGVRALWQAIDQEIDLPAKYQGIAETTLTRLKNRLERVADWSKLPDFQRNIVRKTILIALYTAPHRFVEYAGKSGIWDVLTRNVPDLNWLPFLERLENQCPADQYHAHLQDQAKHPRDRQQRENIPSGWELFDEAAGLHKIYPSDRHWLERNYHFATV